MKIPIKTLVIATALAFAGFGTVAQATQSEGHGHYDQKKLLVCHQTRSEKNPFVVVWVDESSDIANDFPYDGPKGEHGKTDKAWCVEHQPGDVCKNLPGKQEYPPEGQVVSEDGNCVDKPKEEAPQVVAVPPPVSEQQVAEPQPSFSMK